VAEQIRKLSLRAAGGLRLIPAVLGTLFWLLWLYFESSPNPPAALVCVLSAAAFWAAALFRPWRARMPDRCTIAAAALILAAVVPRVVSLEQAPYGFYHDEVIDPVLGLELLQEDPWTILGATSWYFEQPRFTEALQAWPCLFLPPLFGARLASVILAIASLIATYAFARRIFGCRTALFGLSFMILSSWHILYSRMGYPYMQPIFFVPCCLYLTHLSIEKENVFFGYLAGVLAGLSVLAYTPARIVLAILVLWVAHRVFVGGLQLRRAAATAAAAVLGGTIILSPYLHNVGIGGLWQRWGETTKKQGSPVQVFRDHGWASAEGFAALGANLIESGEMYVEYGEEAWAGVEHGLGHPLIDPVTGSLVALALVLAIVRSRESGYALLVMWVAVTFVVAQVLTDLPNAAYRPTPLLPALCILAGVAGDAISKWLRYKKIGTALMVAVLAFAVIPKNAEYIEDYMHLRSNDSAASAARLIAAHSPDYRYYAVTPEPFVHRPEISFYTAPRDCVDVSSLMDAFGEVTEARSDAMFVVNPALASAATIIQLCYPGSTVLAESGHPRLPPVLLVAVPHRALKARPPCTGAELGIGLLARYYADESWEGEIVLERIESWPYRYYLPSDEYKSIAWSGRLRVPSEGTYQFVLGNREGAIGNFSIGSELRFDQSAELELVAGEYPLTIRCRPRNPAGGCWMNWEPPGRKREVIPPWFLVPDMPDVDSSS
jgi:hypothetical protein